MGKTRIFTVLGGSQNGTNMDMPKKPPGAVKRRKKAAERRESLIKVLVTDAERAAFQEAADHAGLNLSTWMRSVIANLLNPARRP